jgi:alpha-amylase
MILSYKDKDLFTKASIFMLAHPHGENHPRLMSSFYFDDPSQGPPQNTSDESIISRGVNSNGACTNGWVCEHRWPQIANMIKFRAVTDGEPVKSFTNIAEDQISFCRGSKGFVAINNSNKNLNATVNACLPDGVYCDVISGDLVNGQCTGKSIVVTDGKANVQVLRFSDGVFATHVSARPSLCSCNA